MTETKSEQLHAFPEIQIYQNFRAKSTIGETVLTICRRPETRLRQRQRFLLKRRREMFIIKNLAPVAQVDRAMDS